MDVNLGMTDKTTEEQNISTKRRSKIPQTLRNEHERGRQNGRVVDDPRVEPSIEGEEQGSQMNPENLIGGGQEIRIKMGATSIGELGNMGPRESETDQKMIDDKTAADTNQKQSILPLRVLNNPDIEEARTAELRPEEPGGNPKKEVLSKTSLFGEELET